MAVCNDGYALVFVVPVRVLEVVLGFIIVTVDDWAWEVLAAVEVVIVALFVGFLAAAAGMAVVQADLTDDAVVFPFFSRLVFVATGVAVTLARVHFVLSYAQHRL